MKLILFSLVASIGIHTNISGQVKVKSESKILEAIEWISNNPVDQTNKKFVSKSADFIAYQYVNYPKFPIIFKALAEFMNTNQDYKYHDEINIVFSSNQLANKIKTGKTYDLSASSLNAIAQVLGYYKLLLKKEPKATHPVLDGYIKMSDAALKNHIIKLLK